MADISFLPSASDDYESAYAWYHERGEHLAEAFEEAVDHALALIADAPLRFGKYDERHQCYLLRRFPYSIVYRLVDEAVIVVAIAHAKRKPGYWQDRQS